MIWQIFWDELFECVNRLRKKTPEWTRPWKTLLKIKRNGERGKDVWIEDPVWWKRAPRAVFKHIDGKLRRIPEKKMPIAERVITTKNSRTLFFKIIAHSGSQPAHIRGIVIFFKTHGPRFHSASLRWAAVGGVSTRGPPRTHARVFPWVEKKQQQVQRVDPSRCYRFFFFVRSAL